MSDQTKTIQDYQLKYPVRLVILKQSPDSQPFWHIPDPLPPVINARCEPPLFQLPGRHDISRGDLLVTNPSYISELYWINCSYCYLVEYVSIKNASSLVIASLYNFIKLGNCVYIEYDLAGFFASLTKIHNSSLLRFAILKRSPGRSFWPIPNPLPFRSDAVLLRKNKHDYLFVFLVQHDIVCGDLLTDCYSNYYLVRQVSFFAENYCIVFAELIDVVKLSDRVYFNNFIESHKPKPIDNLAEFVASLTIGDVFADQWPPEHERANIYIFRDANVIFYVGSSKNVYKRIRAHLGIRMKSSGHPDLYDLVNDNLPDSLNWNIDLYRVKKTYVGDILSCESAIIYRLCPVINQQSNPLPMLLPIRYKWRRY